MSMKLIGFNKILSIAEFPTLRLVGNFAATTAGTTYSSDISITGGSAPYSFGSLITGSLPTGLSLSIVGSVLRLSGTPTDTSGTASFSLPVYSIDGQTAFTTQTIVLNTDPNFAYRVALLHYDGADASTTFTDQTGIIWTPNGAAQISTAQSKFGGSSGSFNGSNSYLKTPNSANFAFGTGDFAVETWARFNTVTGTAQTMMGNYLNSGSGWAFQLRPDAGGVLRFSYGDSPVYDGAFSPAANTWYWLEVSRVGGSIYLFVDGVLKSTAASSTNISYATGDMNIGCLNNSGSRIQWFNGYLDDTRITKGLAVTRQATHLHLAHCYLD